MTMTRLSRYVPMLMLAGVTIAAPACAARIYDNGYPRANYPPPPPPRAAYISEASRNGYRDGVDEGRNDARHRDRWIRSATGAIVTAITTTTAATDRATSTAANIARVRARLSRRLRAPLKERPRNMRRARDVGLPQLIRPDSLSLAHPFA